MAKLTISKLSTATGKNHTLVITWANLIKQLNKPGRGDLVSRYLSKFKDIQIRGTKGGLTITSKLIEEKLSVLLKLKADQGLAVSVDAAGAKASEFVAVSRLAPHLNTITNLSLDSGTSASVAAVMLSKATGAVVDATGMGAEQLKAVAGNIERVRPNGLSGVLTVDSSLTDAELASLHARTQGDSPAVVDGQQVSAEMLNSLDADTRAVVDATGVAVITGTASEVAQALSAPGIDTAANVAVTLAAGQAAASDLNTINASTTTTVDATLITALTGSAADIAAAISAAGIDLPPDVVVTIDAGPAAATDLIVIDSNTSAVVDALLVNVITGAAADVATALNSAGINTAANVGVTLAAGTAAASDLIVIDSNTSAIVDALLVSTLTGTAADLATVLAAAGIDLSANINATLVAGTAAAADLIVLDSNISGIIDARLVTTLTGTAADVATVMAAAAIKMAANVNVTLAPGTAAATDLNVIDSNTSAVVDARQVSTLTGTAAEVAKVVSSAGIDTDAAVEVTVVAGSAAAADLNVIDSNTSGIVDARLVTTLTGAAADVATVLNAAEISTAGDVAVTVTGVGVGLASELKSIDDNTTTRVEASGITSLQGNYADVEAVRTGDVTLGNGYSVSINDAASVLNQQAGNYTGNNDVLAVGAGGADLTGLQGFEYITLGGGGTFSIADGNGTDVSAAEATSAVDVVLGDGPSRGQTFHGSLYADTVMGGIGTDVFVYASDAELQKGERIHGGAGGFDTIRLDAGGRYDFLGAGHASVSNVDRLAINADGINVILNDDFNGNNSHVEIYNDTGSVMYTGVRIDASAFTGGTAGINVATAAGNDFGGDDTMIGGAGADTLIGGGGIDSLIGNDGDDIFVYRDAAEWLDGETIDGGKGMDVIRLDQAGNYDFSTGSVRNVDYVSLNDNSGSMVLTLGDDFNNNGTVEIINSTGEPITESAYIDASAFVGDALLIDAKARLDGDDSISSGTGDDTISAGDGSDTVESGAGNDSIMGDDGNDVIRFASAEFNDLDTVDGGAGTEDWIEILDDATVVDADFSHVSNVEVIYLDGAGAQNVTLGTEADRAGIVEVTSYYGNASTIDIGATTIGKRVWTEEGADTITAGQGNDTLYSNNGDDVIQITSAGLNGSDVVYAGDGDDTLRVTDISATVDASDFSAVDSLETLELIGTGSHTVTLDGLADSAGITRVIALNGTGSTINILDTRGDISVMTAGGQDDITAGSGNNAISTGIGNDRISFLSDSFDSSDTVDGGDGSNEIRILDDATVEDSDFTDVSKINRLQLEGANSQNLTLGLEASEAGILQVWATAGNSSTIDLGSMTNNVEIRTSAGDDLIYGGEGWDTVYSGTGNDTITGGTGVDSLMGEDGDDVFLIHNGKEHDAFYPKLTLAGRETIIGGNGSDEIRFTSTDAAGQLLTLSDDVDVEMARISDAAGDQTGTYNHSIDASRVIGNIELHGNNGHNTLTGNNADNIITGEDGDDTLIAADGNDSVMGGAGDDSITGGAGKDTLDGGDGADTFVVEHWADITSADEVIGGDNVGGVDTLVLKDAGLYDFRDAVGDLKLDGVEVISLDANNGVPTAPFQWGIALDDNAVNNATDQTVTITANVAQTGKVIVVASDILSSDAAIVVKGTNMNGNDLFMGGAGDDTLSAGDGNDGIDGAGGDDVISGDGGADTLYGSDGDDILIFTEAEFGADFAVDGGNDTDTLRITDDANLKDGDFKPVHDLEKLELKGLGVQTVELGTQAGAGFNDVTVLIDSKAAGLNLDASSIGASDKVMVTATINADTLIGGAGDDSLDAGEGHDALTGGAGQDSLTGGAGDDAFIFVNADFGSDSRVDGGDGDDTIRITDDATVVDADFTTVRSVKTLKLEGSGAQSVSLISGSAADDAGLLKIDARDGGASTIDISGTRNHIWVSTEKGNDTITGGSGDNTLVAGDGNDSIDGNDGRDDLIGQDGNDTLRGGNDADILAGVDGNDLLDGGAGDDTLFGGAGNDTLIAGSGNDRIGTDGAGKGDEFGDDVIRFNSADFDWQDTIDGGSDDFSDTNTLEIADDATIIDGDFKNVRDVQKLLLSGTGAQKVTLDQEADKAGLRAIDAIHGNKSDIDIAGTQNNIAVETGAGDDTIMGGTGNNFIVSGADNDSIEGGEGGDTINGGSGKDTLVGNAGADTLIGDAGDDTFVYVSASELEANESIDGGSDTDMIRLDAGGEYRFDKANVSNIERVGINANAAFNLTLGDNFNIDGGTVVIGNLSGAAITQNLVIDASGFVGDSLNVFARNFDGDDTIIGGKGADTINGGAGADIITGGAGDDSLAGGDGNDVFLIGSASDHGANETLSGGNDTDVIRFTTTKNGDILILGSTVTDIEAVRITDEKGDASGTTSAKIDASSVTGAIDLYGNAGDNMFRGNAAANVITGGQGDDWISTGAGADRVIHNVGDGTDTLADFDATQDKYDTDFVSSAGNYNFRTYTPVQTSNYTLAPLTLATQGAGVEGVIEFQSNFDNNSIDFTKIVDVIDAISNGSLSVSSAGGKTLLLLNDLDGGAMSLGASTVDLVDSYLYEVNDLNSNSVVSADEITLVGVFNNVGGTGSGALSVGDIV